MQQLELESRPTKLAASGWQKPSPRERDEPPGEERLAEALQVERAAFVELTHESVSRRANGPIRISPGAAACCSRAATLTASRSRRSSRTRPQPPRPPRRRSALRARGRARSRGSPRPPERALGVVLVRLRDPERGHDGVAGELLDDAAVRGDTVRDVLEERVDAAPDDLGIARGDELVEPTRSTKRTVASLRSMSQV